MLRREQPRHHMLPIAIDSTCSAPARMAVDKTVSYYNPLYIVIFSLIHVLLDPNTNIESLREIKIHREARTRTIGFGGNRLP